MGSKKKQVIWWIISLFTLALVMLVPQRYLYFLHGVPRILFACPFLVAVALAAWIWCSCTGRISRDWLSLWKRCWPLIALTAFDVAFLIFAYLTSKTNPLVTFLPPGRWWANYLFVILAAPAAFFLGYTNRTMGSKRFGIALLVILGFAFIIAAAEYLNLSGYQNPIGQWLLYFNKETRHLYGVWKWLPPGPVRAQGLATGPLFFAFPAAIGMCWALSVRGIKGIRIAILLIGLVSIMLSGSRAALLGIVLILMLSVALQIKKQTFRAWFRAHRKILIGMGAGLIALVIVFSLVGKGTFQSLDRSVETVTVAVNDTKTEVTGKAETDSSQEASDITSGRIALWRTVVSLIIKHPLGTGQPVYSMLKRAYAHNDLLDRMVTGGPISVLIYCSVLFWFLFALKTPRAPYFGLYAGLLILIVGMFEGLFSHVACLPPVWFISGMLVSKEWLTGKVAFTRKGRKKQRTIKPEKPAS